MILSIKATPNASKTSVKRYAHGILYMAVGAPAEDNAANSELLRFLAEKLKIPAQRIKIISGKSARLKRVVLPVAEKELRQILEL